MEKFNEYKDSGIEWLGEIPEHWTVNNLKYLLKDSLKYGANEPAIEENKKNPRYLRITDFDDKENLRENTFKSLPYEIAKSYLLKEGDLLFARSGATVGKTFLFNNFKGKACYAGYLIKASPRKELLISKFLSLFTKSFSYENWKESIFIQATIQNISAEKYNSLPIPLPPLKEQTQIANYLDTKTTAIDKKVNLLQQKIKHYKAYRKTLINETVTKGLEKTVKLKDSGINWIGKIPEHWEVKRLKSVGYISTSSVNKKIEDDEKIVSLVNYTDVYGNLNKEIWNNSSYMKVSAKPNQIIQKNLKKGDMLFTPSSETVEDIGVSSLVMEDLKNTLYSYHILRLRFNYKIYDNFKKYMFNNDFVQYYFSKSAKGTTRKILGLNDFNNLQVVLPSTLEEQQEIADYLDAKTATIDKIVKNIETQIVTLKELRKTLINEVVTGKIKVSA